MEKVSNLKQFLNFPFHANEETSDRTNRHTHQWEEGAKQRSPIPWVNSLTTLMAGSQFCFWPHPYLQENLSMCVLPRAPSVHQTQGLGSLRKKCRAHDPYIQVGVEHLVGLIVLSMETEKHLKGLQKLSNYKTGQKLRTSLTAELLLTSISSLLSPVRKYYHGVNISY